jgi:hypothetical protein
MLLFFASRYSLPSSMILIEAPKNKYQSDGICISSAPKTLSIVDIVQMISISSALRSSICLVFPGTFYFNTIILSKLFRVITIWIVRACRIVYDVQ